MKPRGLGYYLELREPLFHQEMAMPWVYREVA
jgi:hypothetical protein